MTYHKNYGIIQTSKEKKGNKKMYIIYRFDRFSNSWNYLNCFAHYADAAEEVERLEKGFKAQYKIEFEEI